MRSGQADGTPRLSPLEDAQQTERRVHRSFYSDARDAARSHAGREQFQDEQQGPIVDHLSSANDVDWEQLQREDAEAWRRLTGEDLTGESMRPFVSEPFAVSASSTANSNVLSQSSDHLVIERGGGSNPSDPAETGSSHGRPKNPPRTQSMAPRTRRGPVPGAFHRHGRPMGQTPSWSNSTREGFRDEDIEVSISPALAATLAPETETTVERSRSIPAHMAVGIPEHLLPPETSPEPVSANPIDNRLKLTAQQRCFGWIGVLVLLVLGAGIPVGLLVSSRNAEANTSGPVGTGSGNVDTAFVPTCKLEAHDLSCNNNEIVVPECAMTNYERLRADFLPTVDPNSSSTISSNKLRATPKAAGEGSSTSSSSSSSTSGVSCHPSSAALVYLAVATEENPNMLEQQQLDYYLLTIFFLAFKGLAPLEDPEWLNPNVNPCEWRGIGCHNDTTPGSQIQAISFRSEIASGYIPSEIGLLSQLNHLQIRLTPLKGELPSELGSLGELRTLELEGGLATGTIPTEIGNLSNLESFEIASQAISGTLPSEIRHCTNLRSIKLDRNIFMTGTVPAELGSLTLLESIQLIQILFESRSFPYEYVQLTKLSTLTLYDLELTGTMPTELGNLKDLTTLNLGNNELFGTVPLELQWLADLSSLRLDGNDLTGNIDTSLGNCGALGYVDLKNNLLRGTLPSELGKISRLRWLDVKGNILSGNIPPEVCELRKNGLVLSADYCGSVSGTCIQASCE